MIPYRMNPMGISNSGVSILGYAPNAEAFWDGLNNTALGTFDTSSMIWADLTGNGYTLLCADSSPLWDSGGGITGDGTNRRMQANQSPLGEEFTVELVFRKPNTNGSCWWWNNRNPWTSGSHTGIQVAQYVSTVFGLSIYENAQAIYGDNVGIAQNDTSGTVVVAYTGSNIKEYVNGILQTDNICTIPAAVISNTPFMVNGAIIGTLNMQNSGYRIYAVRVYRRALSAAEIQNNYQLDQQRFNV